MNMPHYPMVNPVQQALANGIQSYFNRGTHGPLEYGQVPHQGGYQQGHPQNSWNPPNVAPQHYQPHSGMGFNPNQSTGQHQYGIPQQHEQGGYDKHEHVRQYMRDICSGKEQMPPELMQMMCIAAAEAVQEYMGNGQGGSMQRYSAGEYSEYSQKDKEFKETIEKIRKTQNHQEKMRMIAEYFPRVQQGTLDYKVLVDLVTKVPSIEQRAGALQIKAEQYREIKSNLKNMRN